MSKYKMHKNKFKKWVMFMVFNATFNDISVLLVEETGVS